MIRFALQTTEQALVASKVAPARKPAAIPAAAIEVAEPAVNPGADSAMLLAELPEVSGPASAKIKKVRAERKPKAKPEAEVAQLALEA